MAPCIVLTSSLAGIISLEPLTTRTFASTRPLVELSFKFGVGPGYLSEVSGLIRISRWKNVALGGLSWEEFGRRKWGGSGSVVSTVQLPFMALCVSTMDTNLAGGVMNSLERVIDSRLVDVDWLD